LYIYSIRALNHGQYPYKWLWDYAGDKFFSRRQNKFFTGVSPQHITTQEKLAACGALASPECQCALAAKAGCFQTLSLRESDIWNPYEVYDSRYIPRIYHVYTWSVVYAWYLVYTTYIRAMYIMMVYLTVVFTQAPSWCGHNS
jgi:hypothetical protein